MNIFLLSFLFATVAATSSRPNIVFILTDDQDISLGGLNPIKKTRKLIGDEGATFVNVFASTPVCCPSRSSILTGLYQHNHGVVNNSVSGGCSSPSWQSRFEPETYGAILHKAGYKTFYAGKYLNQYGRKSAGGTEHVPPGWDWWIGLVGNSVYYNYTLSVNGTAVTKGDSEEDYLTDVLKDYSLQFLNQGGIANTSFLLMVTTPAPHAPFTPANKYKGTFKGVKAPRTPNFNVPVNDTKHWLMRLPPQVLPPWQIDLVDEVYRNRWETLLSVDDIVESLVDKLEELGVLNNTYIIYSSDHGFHFGQFGLTYDKRQPYDMDIRIPLFIRGPGISRKTIVFDPVVNIDIAPTILALAGVQETPKTDGKSFLSKIKQPNQELSGRNFLIEYHGEYGDKKSEECYNDSNLYLCSKLVACKCFDAKNSTYTCLRRYSTDADDIYCAFDDDEQFVEYYDMKKDPYQLNNLALDKNQSAFKYHEDVLKCIRDKISSHMSVSSCLF